MSPKLYLCLFTSKASLTQSLQERLREDHYDLRVFHSSDRLLEYVLDQTEQIDCLVLHEEESLARLLRELSHHGKLLPAVILVNTDEKQENQSLVYHPAQVEISSNYLSKVPSAIERAISDFLQLTPPDKPQLEIEQINEFLTIKQHRLTEKLQERLGYKGVYYKRNPQEFFRNLPSDDKKQLISDLTEEYRLILLDYFNSTNQVNPRIDQFVTKAFFADLSVSQIMEIHMDLMDQFSQQLKLEGRSDEILLDYRLTLIDIVAHLCEMYRRSIPIKSTK